MADKIEAAAALAVLPREEKETKTVTYKVIEVMTGFNVVDNFGDVTVNAAFQLHQVADNGDVIGTAQLPQVTRKYNVLKSPDLDAAIDIISALMAVAKAEDIAAEVQK